MHIYYALIKQRIPYLENINQIIRNINSDNSSKIGIKLCELHYTNGPYDCLCKFGAKDIKEAKKYLGYISKEYNDVLVRIDLLESVFPMVKCCKINPKIEELRNFSIK